MTATDFRAYFDRLERHFALKRGKAMLLSPEEYEMVEDLHRRQVPVDVVIRGIDLFFEKRAKRKRKSNRPVFLTHLREHLDELIEEYNRKGMGSHRISGPSGDEFVEQRLAELLRRLEQVNPSAKSIADDAAAAVRDLLPEVNTMEMDTVEQHLEAIHELAWKRISDTLDHTLTQRVEERVQDLMNRTGVKPGSEMLDRFRKDQLLEILRFPLISLYG